MRAPRVLIAGGGPAGAATALALARHGVSAVVLERAEAPRPKPGECLTPGFRRVLARLGLEALLESGGHRRLSGIASAWEGVEPVERDFSREAGGRGWLVDREALEAQLVEEARARGVRWHVGWEVVEVERRDEGWRVVAAGARGRVVLEADFLVDATGRSAVVARRLGVGLQRFDRLVASWGLLEPEGGPVLGQEGPIHIEAVPEGWWYAARLPGGRLSVVRFSEGAVREPEPFLEALRGARHAAALLGGDGWRWVRPPSAWPAHSARLEQVCGPGWFAVGDAAGCFDPLSSYGIGSAMGTGFYAAQALVATWRGESEAGEAYRWLLEERYQRYLEMLGERYRSVSRWPEAPFWSARLAG